MKSPFALPIIGHLHLFAKYPDDPVEAFENIREKYGDIVDLKLGSQKYLLISDLRVIQYLFTKSGERFTDRPFFRSLELLQRRSEQSVYFSPYSDEHDALRRTLKHYCLTSFAPDQMIMFERNLIESFDQFTDGIGQFSILLRKDISNLAGNSIFDQLCHRRFPANDPGFQEFLQDIDQLHDLTHHGFLFDFIPFLYHIWWSKTVFSEANDLLEKVRSFLSSNLNIRRECFRMWRYEPNDRDNRYFLGLMLKNYHENLLVDVSYKCIQRIEEILIKLPDITNLVMACLGYISLNKHVQDNIRHEIGRKFGTKKEILSLSEAMSLIYTQATIRETLRLTGSLSFPLKSPEPVEITRDYMMPIGTAIILNIHHIHHSSDYWKFPNSFYPNHFLSEDGDRLESLPAFMPFGYGKRSCPGHGLFDSIASFLVANFVNKFHIQPNCGPDEMASRGLRDILSMKTDNFFSLNLKKRDKFHDRADKEFVMIHGKLVSFIKCEDKE
ncbi:cytochrome P450 307a1-like isoform X2 [Brevipalpus obovatus]|uniref:cytochrome P450 307a1-like isoform X2 n=1 Tax=Brevipalpus obovatus TaxID=246614 RepID=UPI003D9E76BB